MLMSDSDGTAVDLVHTRGACVQAESAAAW